MGVSGRDAPPSPALHPAAPPTRGVPCGCLGDQEAMTSHGASRAANRYPELHLWQPGSAPDMGKHGHTVRGTRSQGWRGSFKAGPDCHPPPPHPRGPNLTAGPQADPVGGVAVAAHAIPTAHLSPLPSAGLHTLNIVSAARPKSSQARWIPPGAVYGGPELTGQETTGRTGMEGTTSGAGGSRTHRPGVPRRVRSEHSPRAAGCAAPPATGRGGKRNRRLGGCCPEGAEA